MGQSKLTKPIPGTSLLVGLVALAGIIYLISATSRESGQPAISQTTTSPVSISTTTHDDMTAEALIFGLLSIPNRFEITAEDLASKSNSLGAGTIVYIPLKTRFNGVQRHFAWFVLDELAFNLNGATAVLTPELPWPREADINIWNRSGLDRLGSDALEQAFP